MDPRRPPVNFVLDASAALAWAFERAAPGEAEAAQRLLDRLKQDEALVPDLWHLEVANALVVAHRRGVVSLAQARDFLARLAPLPIRTDATSAGERREHLFDLAREYGCPSTMRPTWTWPCAAARRSRPSIAASPTPGVALVWRPPEPQPASTGGRR
jgi:predicted nucleic acid-binding protein